MGERLFKLFLIRRGVPAELIKRLETKAGVNNSFWEFLVKFLIEFGLPALIEFLKRLLEDLDPKAASEEADKPQEPEN